MKLERIKIKNFLCIGDVDVKLSGRGLVLVLGNNLDDEFCLGNMAGKSAFFEAIVFGLYGKTYRGIKGKSVIRDGCEECSIKIGVDGGSITRNVSCKSNNRLSIAYDGHMATTTLTDTGQGYIDEFLGMDYLAFINLVMFGDDTANKNQHLFGSGTNSYRFDVLRPFLNFETWDKAQLIAKDEVAELENDIRISNTKIHDNEHEIEKLNFGIQQIEEQVKKIRSDIAEAEKKEFEDVGNLDEIVIRKEQVITELSELKKGEPVLKEKMEGLESQIDEQHSILSINNTSLSWQNNRYGEIRFVVDSKKCPLFGGKCEQSDVSGEMDALEISRSMLESDIKINNSNTKKLKEDLQFARSSETMMWDNISKTQEEVGKLNIQIEKAKNLEKEKESHVQGIKKLTNRMWELINRQTEHKVEIEDLGNKISDFKMDIKDLEKDLKLTEFWIKGFGDQGTKNVELRRLVPFINNHIKHFLPQILSSDYKIELSSCRELTSKKIKNEIGLEMSGDYWRKSCSERKKINYLLGLALSRLHPSGCNVLFYDELFSSLDSHGTEIVVKLFNNMIESGQLDSVFMVSHKDLDLFDNKIVFQKKDGVTTVKED